MANLDGPAQEDVDALYWWHSITFPNGVKSRGGKSEQILRAEADAIFRYPVAGKSVLDIGAWNGFFSVEAKRRGAARVAAMDYWTWDRPPHETGFKSFELVRRYLAPDVEDIHLDVMDLKQSGIGQFDCVLFLGVLYHLRHPFYAIELLAECTRELLVLETALDAENYARPAMVFYPGKELNGDDSNWWGPNRSCVTEMLRVSGFKTVEVQPHPLHKGRAIFYARK